MKTVCFSSPKGGSGKSSLTILLANYVASTGQKVLVIDFDLQNSVTSYYLDSPDLADMKNIAMVLFHENVEENIIPTNYPGVDLIASSLDIVKFRNASINVFSDAIKKSNLSYDYIFIDTAPTYDNLVLNAICGSDLTITPVEFAQFDFKTTKFFGSQLERETNKFGAWRILFNKVRYSRSDNPEALQNQYRSLYIDSFPDIIVPVGIPFSTLVRKYTDTSEKMTQVPQKLSLFTAISDLAKYFGVTQVPNSF